jgi:hypothetical protein
VVTPGGFDTRRIGNAYKVRTFRLYLIKAPARRAALIVGVVGGAFFGTMMGLIYAYQNHDGTPAAAFGTFMGWRGTKQRESLRTTVGPMPPEKYLAALDAARKGPIPSDPEIREAARHILALRLRTAAKAPKSAVALFGFFVLLSVYEALTSDPLYWLGVPFFAGVGLFTYRQTMTTRQRAQLYGMTA